MNPENVRPLLSPEEIAVRSGEQVPFLRRVDPMTVFAERAARLRTLAPGHPLGEYLMFIADVAQAQHQIAQQYPALRLADATTLDAAAGRIEPPYRASQWERWATGWAHAKGDHRVAASPRDPAWRDGLRRMLDELLNTVDAGPARQLIGQLQGASDTYVDQQADRVLNGITTGLNLASAPLIAAALQVYWSCLVAQTAAAHGESVYGRTAVATACPCCGSAPTTSISRLGAETNGARYLHCSLCSSQWHLVRIKCAHCQSTKGISYQELQLDVAPIPGTGRHARSAAVKAECCAECGCYLKIVHMDKDPGVDPVADDLATISLDLLVTETGLEPAGINLMLWYGEPADA